MSVYLFIDLIVLVGPGLEHGPGALDVDEDVGEGTYGISIATHHHVGKPYVIVGGDLARSHTGVHRLLVQLNVLQHLQPKTCNKLKLKINIWYININNIIMVNFCSFSLKRLNRDFINIVKHIICVFE